MIVKLKCTDINSIQCETEKKLHAPSIPKWLKDIDTEDAKIPAVLAVDTECTGLHWSAKDRPFAISLAWYDQDNMRLAYYDWPVDPYTREPKYQGQKGLNLFSSLYHNPKVTKVFANAKYDMHMIYQAFGMFPKGRIDDVLIMAWCCNTQEKSYKLNDLAEKYLSVDQKDEYKLKEGVRQRRSDCKDLEYKAGPKLSTIPEDYWLLKTFNHQDERCREYALKDAGPRTLDLYYFYLEALKDLNNLEAYNREIEVLHVIYEMEKIGIRFYEDVCISQIEKLQKFCTEKMEWICKQFNAPNLNINSAKQLIPYIFQYGSQTPETSLRLTPEIWTDGGKSGDKQPATDTESLKKLIHKDPKGILQALIDYRGHNQGIKAFKNYLEHAVKDEYVTPYDLPFLHQKKSIHPSFNQIAVWGDKQNKTRTGRLSASNPNIQNVADPEKSIAVVDAREAFGPRDGYVWYCIDYSQLELRLFAERTGGKLKKAFLAGRDPHDETRQAVPFLAKMDPGRGRKIAKNTNFTIINCGGANVLEKKYGVPLAEGKIVVKEFYQAFPETSVRQFDAQKFAIENGYIETITGRKINVDLTQVDGKYIYAYRATSYDIQGSAADIIKIAMIKCSEFLKKTKYDARLILSIHDELVFEIKRGHTFKKLIQALKSIMENVATSYIDIPLECEVQKTTTNWSTKEKQDVVL